MIKLLRALIPELDNFLSKYLGIFADIAMVLVDIFIIYVLVRVISALLKKAVIHSFKRKMERSGSLPQYKTLSKLCEHAVTVAVWYMGVVAVLSELELATTVMSMLATAGIGGVAIGLGAQSLIKDMINGTFLLVEQQIAVGDFVKIADVDGTVEDINLRTIRLRAGSGELHIIPNSAITVVTNFSRGTNRAIVDVPIPYDSNPAGIASLLQDTMNSYYGTHAEALREVPKVVGVVEYGSSAIMLRIVAHCHNLGHWETERNIRSEVLKLFNEKGISIPYGTVVVLAHQEEK